MKELKELTLLNWINEYNPIEDSEKNYVQMFETYGEDFDFIKSQHPLTIWTLVEYEGEELITNGYHFVNRLGYYITEKQFDPELNIEVVL